MIKFIYNRHWAKEFKRHFRLNNGYFVMISYQGNPYHVNKSKVIDRNGDEQDVKYIIRNINIDLVGQSNEKGKYQ